jgi:type IV fimbrial biogenesis protein FimT
VFAVTPAPRRRARARGFTLIEAAVVLAIIGILLAAGMPSMANWLLARKAMAAAVFYQDGMALARNTAIAHNAHSRLVLTPNAANGKMDWQVDLCFSSPCTDVDGSWSTPTTYAAGDAKQGAQWYSVQRSAQGMPNAGALVQTLGPDGATAVYFTALGWVDTTVGPALASIDFKPAAGRASAFRELMVKLPLGGIAAICDPNAAAHAANGCPP